MLSMRRRSLLQLGLGTVLATPLLAALRQDKLEAAAEVLTKATADGTLAAATLYVRQKGAEFAKAFGKAKSVDAMFLLGSISKPIAMTAVMTLYDQQKIALDGPAKKYLPECT